MIFSIILTLLNHKFICTFFYFLVKISCQSKIIETVKNLYKVDSLCQNFVYYFVNNVAQEERHIFA